MTFKLSAGAMRLEVSAALVLVSLALMSACTSPERAFGDDSSGASGHAGATPEGGAAGSSSGSGGSAAGTGGVSGTAGASSGVSGDGGAAGSGGEAGDAGTSGTAGAGGSGGTSGTSGGTQHVGQICGDDGDCEQGNCADGICCDQACDGACEACIQIYTGLANGMCAPAIPGAPPHSGCSDEGATSCGHTGVCDGSGNCAFYSTATACGAQTCSAGAVTPAPACDGAGQCVTPSPITCTPNPTCIGDACQGACTSDEDCGGGTTQYCDLTAGGLCTTKQSTGSLCNPAVASHCMTGQCVDGFCCESSCTAACQHCNAPGSPGVCSTLTSADDTSPSNVCAGANSCDTSGTCRAKNGQACSSSTDCVSGFCVDGYCCDGACTDTCKTCGRSGLEGTCSPLLSAQDTFPAGICTGNFTCDATGSCKKKNNQACGGPSAECASGYCVDGYCCSTACTADCYACNLNIGTCVPSNTGSTDGACQAPSACSGGTCKKGNGSICTTQAQCVSGFCVDGVCCNSSCTGLCKSCKGADTEGINGVCANISCVGDPYHECPNINYTCSNGACVMGQSCL